MKKTARHLWLGDGNRDNKKEIRDHGGIGEILPGAGHRKQIGFGLGNRLKHGCGTAPVRIKKDEGNDIAHDEKQDALHGIVPGHGSHPAQPRVGQDDGHEKEGYRQVG